MGNPYLITENQCRILYLTDLCYKFESETNDIKIITL